jgi:hypothetical protein
MEHATQYPHHLAKLVAARLRADYGRSPPETALCRLLETLYFASLKTAEGRPIRCTVDYVDPQAGDARPAARGPANRPTYARFDPPLPFDVRTLTKLGRAADPTVASLAAFCDSKNRLFIWAMVDQEPRWGEEISRESAAVPRPGLFRATITGPGNISVCSKSSLVGSLVQNALVQEHYNVLWSGPIHAMLKDHLEASLAERFPTTEQSGGSGWRQELLVRWINAVCRVLVEAERYRQGGGLLIVPEEPPQDVSAHYSLRYDRLLAALVKLVQSRLFDGHLHGGDQAAGLQEECDGRKSEVLGAIRFIASLSCADGVVLLDKALSVRGFGAELRTASPINDVFLAGDAMATAARLRRTDLTCFGARPRAMIRYCDAHPGSLGLAISRDGGVQAMTRIGQRLVFWENIEHRMATAGRAP